MQINLEQAETHAIQGYSETEIKIDAQTYGSSLIISRQEIIVDWSISSVQELDENLLQPLLSLNPEVIIIGHKQTGQLPPIQIYQQLSKLRIGLECMSIGAASRTFNILLNEYRAVVAGMIL